MFEEEVLALAKLRNRQAQLKDEVDKLRQEWEKANANILSEYALTKEIATATEATLRATIVSHFERTGNKKPHPRLGIRETVKVLYDKDEVTDYARLNAHDLLVLDKKKLERYVKALAGDSLILGGTLGELIEFVKEPIATIAKKLED